jgi:uncharacterized membrane protein YeaQ/YmgE (transglycosylase-associated protein family)
MALIALMVVVILLVFGMGIFGVALWAFWTLAWYCAVGVVIGGLGRLFVPGRQQMSLLATALFGVAGALLGGIVGRSLLDAGWFVQFLCAVIAAALLILATGYGRQRAPAA